MDSRDNKYSLKNKSIPPSFYYLTSRILIGIGQLAAVKVLTSIFNPIEIGKYYLIISITSILSIILINPVLIYISRHFYGWYQEGVGWLAMKKLIVYLIITSIPMSVLLLILKYSNFGQGQLLYGNLYFFIPLLVIGGAIASYPLELLNIVGKYRTFIVLSNVEVYGKIGIIIIFSFLFSPIAMTIIGAITFWVLIFPFLSGTLLYRRIKDIKLKRDTFKFAGLKEIFNFTLPFLVAAVFYWCQTDGYRFVLQQVSGAEVVGKFIVGFNLGVVFMVALDSVFHQLYMPIYYREISAETVESHTDAWNVYAQKIVKIFIPFGLYIACAGPFLAHWLLGSTYWDMGIYVAFGAICQIFRIFTVAFYNGIMLQKRTIDLLIPCLTGAVIALLGVYLFAFRSPIVGTGIILILSYASVCVGLYYKLSNKLHIQLPLAAILKSVLLVVPICIALVVSYKFGFATVPLLNIFTLLLTGLSMIYIQWILSGDVWFGGHESI